jgi:hypothetical protein
MPLRVGLAPECQAPPAVVALMGLTSLDLFSIPRPVILLLKPRYGLSAELRENGDDVESANYN